MSTTSAAGRTASAGTSQSPSTRTRSRRPSRAACRYFSLPNLQFREYNPTPSFKGQFSTDFQRKVGAHYDYNFVRSNKKFGKARSKRSGQKSPYKQQ